MHLLVLIGCFRLLFVGSRRICLSVDYNPYTLTPKFVELLNSQQDSVFRLVEESRVAEDSSQFRLVEESQATPAERRERRKWTPTDDIVLISSWLNTSKDPVVGNEQRSGAFWKRIAAYFAGRLQALNREKLATVSSVGTRSMILSPKSVRTVHNHQAHTQLVKLIKVPFDPLVLRQQRFLVRRLW
uniref:Myb-like domain-containing protein n=1 Tax=Brassica oleracea TaxID=3712 RepID=A0A3P6BCL0_BRAOL|nr:unnamed protein product [Brassica oleracea]